MPEAVTHSFQAEVSEVLRLVIHSLYSQKDIFLRELVSNASDALDRLRFRALTEPDIYEGDTSLVIRIRFDRDRKTLAIEDSGVGMTEEELVRDLGTVARSGSRAFLEEIAKRGQKDARLIGQFGVGFYSAYLVADRVEVISRAAGPGHTAHRWESDGRSTFTVAPDDRPARGTEIRLHLRDEHLDLLDDHRLRELVKRYSDYVSHPIQLFVRGTKGAVASAAAATEGAADEEREVPGEGRYETVNRGSALWQRAKSEITSEQYDEFYRHLAHTGDGAPIARTHFKVEGTQEFAGLFYIPREKPFELRLGIKHRGVRLYVKRVLVMEDCDEIVPEWLRFVVGVIDSDDLPLNVSRELLQESSAVRTIRRQVVKHVLETLETMAGERPADYATFWRAFGPYVKHGAASDFEHRERVAKLLRYESTVGEGLVSLGEYVARMKEGQNNVYYVVGETRKALESAPHLEGLRKRGYEVLLMTDPIDDLVADSLSSFEGKPLVSAMRADLKMDASDDEKKAREAEAGALRPLFERIRSVLGARVTEVRASARLIDSPCCLVLTGAGPHGYVERLLREAGRDVARPPRILEVNALHPIIKSLEGLVARDDGRASDWIEVLYDQALIAEGAPLDDPGGFARRVTSLLSTVSSTISGPAAGA
jgi:molecular chaperone HtpG